MDFTGKNVIVTGAAQGIGRATALLFAERGANVIITDVNRPSLLELEEELTDKGVKTIARICDVADESNVRDTVEEAIRKLGRIDVLINNAGIYKDGRMLFVHSNSEYWKTKININILGVMYFTHAVLDNMIENKYGRIVNIASVAGVYGLRNMVDYSMTKGAVIAFSRALSKEVGPYGITVNAVSPGNINEKSISSDMSFLGRSGSTRECAQAICFLASDEASYISGQNYQVDGSRKSM
ncbi:MAG: short-chain dehydrogenase/reductase [Paenibacillus sp.]|nr:short-chain dehydrogenase/reductase [Paenibacillus sp.]